MVGIKPVGVGLAGYNFIFIVLLSETGCRLAHQTSIHKFHGTLFS